MAIAENQADEVLGNEGRYVELENQAHVREQFEQVRRWACELGKKGKELVSEDLNQAAEWLA